MCQNRHVWVASWFRLLRCFSNQTLVAPYLLLLWPKAAITCKFGWITEVRGDKPQLSEPSVRALCAPVLHQAAVASGAASPFRPELQLLLSQKHFPSRTLTPAASVGKIWTIKWRQLPASFYILLSLLAEVIWAILKSIVKEKSW